MSYRRVREADKFAPVSELREKVINAGVPPAAVRIKRCGVGRRFFALFVRNTYRVALCGSEVLLVECAA